MYVGLVQNTDYEIKNNLANSANQIPSVETRHYNHTEKFVKKITRQDRRKSKQYIISEEAE